MGSFYGTVFQELKKAFNRFKFKNNGSATFPESQNNTQPDLSANGKTDALNISAGNHWIKFISNPEEQEVEIFHNKSHTNDFYKVPIFKPKDTQDKNYIQLEPGQCFEIATELNYDAAGHETLPTKLKERPTQIYRLPMTDTEVELSDIKDRITELESDRVVQSEFQEMDSRVDKLETDAPTYATKTMTGSVDDMKTSSYYSYFTNIAQLIGNVEELNKSMDFNPEDGARAMSLCDGLKEIIPLLMDTVSELQSLTNFQQIDIYELKTRIKDLEDSKNN